LRWPENWLWDASNASTKDTSFVKALREALVDFAVSVTGVEDNLDGLGEAIEKPRRSAEESAAAIAALDAEMLEIAGTAANAESSVFNFSTGLSESSDALDGQARELGTTIVPLFQSYEEAVAGAVEQTSALGKDGARLTGYFSVVSSGADAASKSVSSLAGASDELRSKAVVAAIEGATDINVAKIEADAERAVAAFDSINNTVSDTSDFLDSLFGKLGDDNISKFDKLGIQEQIRRETELREKTTKLQQSALRAEIKKANAQAAALRRGDALIRVDGAGLQPHLEAFMFEILESIQVRVNEDGQQLLLGLG